MSSSTGLQLGQKGLIGLTLISYYLWFRYDTPEKNGDIFYKYGIGVQPGLDLPSLIPIFAWLWALILFGQVFFKYEQAYHSDYVLADGMDSTESCIGGRLHEVGEIGWIRVGGIKAFPIEGSSVWIGLLSHIHRIGTHIIFESHMVPNTRLVDVPLDVKLDIRQRRDGLFGIKDCSVGYLTSKELLDHKDVTFEKDSKYAKYLDTKEIGKSFLTSAFIGDVRNKNRAVDMTIQLSDNESESLKEQMETISDVGRSVIKPKKKGIFDVIMGTDS